MKFHLVVFIEICLTLIFAAFLFVFVPISIFDIIVISLVDGLITTYLIARKLNQNNLKDSLPAILYPIPSEVKCS